MGKVTVKLKLTNYDDLVLQKHNLSKRKPRSLIVEALVDTGATRLYLRPSVIRRLGLRKTDVVRSRTTNGEVLRFKFEPVQLELLGRRENFDVIEVPESVPNLLGQVPLEILDLVVDSKQQKLIPNPEHDGEQMTEEYQLREPAPYRPTTCTRKNRIEAAGASLATDQVVLTSTANKSPLSWLQPASKRFSLPSRR